MSLPFEIPSRQRLKPQLNLGLPEGFVAQIECCWQALKPGKLKISLGLKDYWQTITAPLHVAPNDKVIQCYLGTGTKVLVANKTTAYR